MVLPYQTLLVKGSASFKEDEEAKAIPDSSNQPTKKIKAKKEVLFYRWFKNV
jgi:hypothetical protein